MIKLTNDFVIEVIDRNYILERDMHKNNKKGKPIINILGYYSTLPGAIRACADAMSKEELQKADFSLKEAVNIITESHRKIETLLEETK